ncbi:MAG TPA: tRNA epoxyqueuosine(34) reductase QueG [Candidatus Methylacidiphilales bacterium]|jgi:epoxyqueuosine reductase|nr:tRNA epoxyqueuosine(34) reductase QueG [Candidatus Methylacidiphilales bacterium]
MNALPYDVDEGSRRAPRDGPACAAPAQGLRGLPDSTAIKKRAAELGLDACGITGADPARHAAFYRQWIAEGRAGEMQWLAREPERRADPAAVLSGARSIIVAGLNYWQPQPKGRGRIARYALGDDYHHILLEKLGALAAEISSSSGAMTKVYVDTGPVLEKPLANRAGIGWQGKSTMLIHRRLGPWLLLGEIITTLELEPDAPERDHCGSCLKCIAACPTGAITAPYQLDARRCIAYLTIELKGSIPEELRPLIGDRVYGCDECLDVCPWNRFARTTREARFLAKPDDDSSSGRDPLHVLLEISPAEFKRRFARSPILRVKRRGLLRNVCVVLGNIGAADDLPALRRAEQHEEPLVREHAAWAIRQIEKRNSSI